MKTRADEIKVRDRVCVQRGIGDAGYAPVVSITRHAPDPEDPTSYPRITLHTEYMGSRENFTLRDSMRIDVLGPDECAEIWDCEDHK